MADTLRVGIVGAGGIVEQRHLPGLAKIDGVQVVAVANRTRESGERVAGKWDIPEVMVDWRQLVARDDVDIVLIGTWPYLHRDVTVAALMAGKHVFCQARMTMNFADAKHMYERSQLSDRVTAICPPPHVLAVERLMRKYLDDGFLGELRHVRLTSLSGGGADPGAPANWRQRAAYSGLNAMALGIWVEILHKWVGYCSEVMANNRVWVDERPDGDGGSYHVTIPDSVTVLTTFEQNNAQGVLHLSSVAHHGGKDRVELYGSDGTIVVEAGADGILAGRAGDGELSFVEVPDDLANEWTVEQNFIDAIREGATPQTTFYQGLKYMEFVEAVYRSQQSGARVRLPLAV